MASLNEEPATAVVKDHQVDGEEPAELPYQTRNVTLCAALFVMYMAVRTGILQVAPLAATEMFKELDHTPRWYEPTTLPFAALFIADMLLAVPHAWLIARYGYRVCFMLGGCLGACSCAFAGAVLLVADTSGPSLLSYWLLSLSGLALGPFALTEFARYAAASAGPPSHGARIIGRVLGGSFINAFFSPALVTFGTSLAGQDAPLRGASFYYFTCVVLCLIFAVVASFLRLPEKAKEATAATVTANGAVVVTSKWSVFGRPALQAAWICSFGLQWFMMLLMSATPMALTEFLGLTGTTWQVTTVLGVHMFGMFATGLWPGGLQKRLGTFALMVLGWIVSVAGAVLAFLLHRLGLGATATLGFFYTALLAIGVGWHFAFIGATKMLIDNHSKAEQAAVQGVNEWLRCVAMSATIWIAGSVQWSTANFLATPVLVVAIMCTIARMHLVSSAQES